MTSKRKIVGIPVYVFRIAVGWSKRDIVNFSCSADCLDFTRAAWKDGIVTFYIEKLFDRDDITKLENYIRMQDELHFFFGIKGWNAISKLHCFVVKGSKK